MPKPAERLLGEVVNEKWKVVKKIEKKDDETGGCFSVGYIVHHEDGRKGFLKAIDFSVPRGEMDAADFIQRKTRLFTFEKEILRRCKDDKLRRVVVAIEDGHILEVGSGSPIVQFLIFELADGNLHHRESLIKNLNDAFVFRVAQHVALGLWQIHQRGIAHLDIKPSNVLLFSGDGSKIADFGRSSIRGSLNPLPHELIAFAGDPAHAPIETLYGYQHAEWNVRRLGCDLYHLGSLVIQLLTNVQLTAQILTRLPKDQWPGTGTTFLKALPQIRDVQGKIIADATEKLPLEYREKIRETLRELCEPEPERRGNIGLNNDFQAQYSAQRYVGRFDWLATRAEIAMRAR